MNGIAWNGVSAGYGATTIIEEIDLTVAPGERIGVLGRNGAGKTTMLSAMTGGAQILKGTVRAGDRDLSNLPPWARSRAGIGVVPQTRDIFRSLTVRENLMAGGGTAADMADAFALFPRLKERLGNLGADLSGGEQQMLSIARALMNRPTFLLLDEPLEGLSPLVSQDVMAAIRKLVSDRNLGCVLVEQHVGTVLDFCDRVLVLQRGRVVFSGTSDALRTRPDVLESAIGLSGVSG
ncbi:ABC transporter ATP-binding protein [Seohaeicola zhoushanensis]|uniref:ABC transporter ATP-binding protein n=1 Tax=Seohaeicola zhoushanensis TaxID=1569283 RepID=A0A8J3H1F4_9RHOB|nr:ABC transporter ATP-binding protein [Seohaeicola zhoushanensis]GHF72273.1 ABC transporter ATP-binding protein [Seohaeicola zhoushanensis]